VLARSGSGSGRVGVVRRAGGGGVARRAGGVAGAGVRVAAWLVVDSAVDGVVADVGDPDGEVGAGRAADVHAARTREPSINEMSRRNGTGTRPASHATPMSMRGRVLGASHFMSDTSLLCEIATHPAVALPLVTWKKNALPAPWCTGKRLVLNEQPLEQC
jgi:hypothetical protein